MLNWKKVVHTHALRETIPGGMTLLKNMPMLNHRPTLPPVPPQESNTVKPVLSRHHWDLSNCLLNRERTTLISFK